MREVAGLSECKIEGFAAIELVKTNNFGNVSCYTTLKNDRALWNYIERKILITEQF